MALCGPTLALLWPYSGPTLALLDYTGTCWIGCGLVLVINDYRKYTAFLFKLVLDLGPKLQVNIQPYLLNKFLLKFLLKEKHLPGKAFKKCGNLHTI